jgi:hypothetical protein
MALSPLMGLMPFALLFYGNFSSDINNDRSNSETQWMARYNEGFLFIFFLGFVSPC